MPDADDPIRPDAVVPAARATSTTPAVGPGEPARRALPRATKPAGAGSTWAPCSSRPQLQQQMEAAQEEAARPSSKAWPAAAW